MEIKVYSTHGNVVGTMKVETISRPGQRYTKYSDFKPLNTKGK